MQRKNKIFILIMVCIICFSMGLTWTILPSIVNILTKESIYNINDNKYALLGSILVITALLFSNIAGILGRKKGLKNVVVYGVFLSFLGLCSYSYGSLAIKDIYKALIIGQILLGIGISFILTSLTAYVCLLLPNLNAISLTGIFACINLGSFSSPIFFNLSSIYHFSYKILVINTLVFVVFLFSLRLLPNIEPAKSSQNNAPIFFLRKKYFLVLTFLLIIILYSTCEYIYAYWGIVYLNEIKKISLSLSRYALSSYWAAFGIAQITIFWLLRYFSSKLFYKVLPIFIAGGFLIIFYSNNYIYSLMGFIIGGLGSSAFVPLTLSFTEYSFKEISEIIAGIMIMGYFTGYFLGSLFLNMTIRYANLSLVFFIASFTAIFIIILSLYVMGKMNLQKKNH